MKQLLYIFLFSIAVLVFIGAWLRIASDEGKEKILKLGGVEYQVEVARTFSERARGLGERASLAEGWGMLFVFDTAGRHAFWMKDMRFPIDIVWLNSEYEIVFVAPHVDPGFTGTIVPPVDAKYVLEVNAGEVERAGASVGDRVHILP